MNRIIIDGCDLVLENGILKNGVVEIRNDCISFVGTRDEWINSINHRGGNKRENTHFSFENAFLVPAFVELHLHGCGGYSFEDNLKDNPQRNDPDDFINLSSFLSGKGVGVFLPTIVYRKETIVELADKITEFKKNMSLPGNRIAGIYIEGPFISMEKRGGIDPSSIMKYSAKLFDEIYSESRGLLKMMTFAPDAEGLTGNVDGFIALMKERNVIPAAGHSNALFENLKDLSGDLSPANVTHLFNGMSGVSHKNPGLALWALLDENAFVELNVDGVHVHPWAVDLALKVKNHEKLVLISDAVPASGIDSLTQTDRGINLRGRPLKIQGNGIYDKKSNVLVGSNLLVKDMVKRAVSFHSLPLWEAVNMASRNPLRLLGMTDRGTIQPQKKADISVFDKSFEKCLLQVFEGKITFQA